MDSLRLAREYIKEVEKEYGDMLMLVYGSTVFGVETSDLDVCFIRDLELSKSDLERLKEITKMFHIKNNLRIDEEVPYDMKLIYTYSFLDNTLLNPPFPYENGKYNIPLIQKKPEFLGSIAMKKRLILNILTSKHYLIGDSEDIINNYSNMAWELILKVVISYALSSGFTLEELFTCLYKDPFNKVEGEMYLGYKTNLEEKKLYLEEMVNLQLKRLEKDDKIEKVLKKGYIPNPNWINKR